MTTVTFFNNKDPVGKKMAAIGNILVDASSVAMRYAKRLTSDIPADKFGRLATPGGVVIQSNHPAFVIGHLSLYPAKAMQLLKLESGPTTPSARFVAVFAKDSSCLDDTSGFTYPVKDELLQFFDQAYTIVRQGIREASDELLLSPTADDSPMKTLFPTVGAMLAFYIDGHVLMHLGQVSAWRRMQGMAPV
jgi:hypothetical protein